MHPKPPLRHLLSINENRLRGGGRCWVVLLPFMNLIKPLHGDRHIGVSIRHCELDTVPEAELIDNDPLKGFVRGSEQEFERIPRVVNTPAQERSLGQKSRRTTSHEFVAVG